MATHVRDSADPASRPALLRGIVLDLDDTLYPELDFVRSGFRAVAAAFADLLGPPDPAFERLWRSFQTGDRGRVFDAALAGAGRPPNPDLIARMVDTYRRHSPTLALHADADRALARLRSSAKLGVLTDGPLETQRNKIAVLGLTARVDVVLVTEELGRAFWKPHVRGFEEIAARLDCSHAELAYVADNPAKDFVAPNALGWTTVHIRRSGGVYCDAPAARSGEPQITINTLDELAW